MMVQRVSLLLLLVHLPLFFFCGFPAILSLSDEEDPTTKTMEDFSGYPIHEHHFPNSVSSISVDTHSLEKKYVATLREQLDQLAEERTPEGLPRVSKAMVNDYSEKIEVTAAILAVPSELFAGTSVSGRSPSKAEGKSIYHSPGLRRRFEPPSIVEDRAGDAVEDDQSTLVKLDAAAQAHIGKHRKLQEDLTNEMVGLARQLKESSLMMSQSLKNMVKVITLVVNL